MKTYDPVFNAFFPRAKEISTKDQHAVEISTGVTQGLLKATARAQLLWNHTFTLDDAVEFASLLADARLVKPLIMDGAQRPLEEHLPLQLLESRWWQLAQYHVAKMTHAQQCGPGELFLSLLHAKTELYNGGTKPGDFCYGDSRNRWFNVEVKSGDTNFFQVKQRAMYQARGVDQFISLNFCGDGKKPTKHPTTTYRGFPIEWLFDEQYAYIDGDKVKMR